MDNLTTYDEMPPMTDAVCDLLEAKADLRLAIEFTAWEGGELCAA